MTTTKRPKPLPIEIRVMTPDYAAALDELQKIIFPTLTDDERFSAANYRKHIEVFPDGQYMAVLRHPDGDVVVGACSAIRQHFDFDHIQHTFAELTDNGWLTTHEPDGDWLYGIDMSVHPAYRRRRIASRMYRVRMNVVRRLNLRGEIIGGMMPGYDRHRKKYSIEDYVQQVADGTLTDPTLTAQMKQGFAVRGILYDHITDPRSNDCAVLMVRDNPDYMETSLENMPEYEGV
ncbi:MAG: GNAT family N-acetyltransferase [Chloroflexota bacterium]